MTERKCLQCGEPLERITCDTIQLGQTDWLLGDLPNLVAGGLDVLIMTCPQCGRIELFRPTEEDKQPQGGMVTCPQCGKKCRIGTRRCPECGHALY